MSPCTTSSNPSSDSDDDQRLQFHLQLMGRLPNRPEATTIESRASSASSIASVRSFRSARSKPPLLASAYRPSPLRSASTPDLGVMDTAKDTKQHHREMKEEYDKMRAARIAEEKQLQQRHRDKSSSHDTHQSWFSSRFKRNTTLAPTTHQTGRADGLINERRSTSQSSATESTAQSYSVLDDRSPSVGTVPTSEEGTCQVISESPSSKDSQENSSVQTNSFDSPVIDPFRKSMLPGQVPPTPTKLTIISSQTPKSTRIFTPGRNKLNRLFENLKFGGGNHHHDNHDHPKRKTQISVVESNTPAPLDQPSWLDSIKSIRSISRSSRRKTLVGMFLPEKDLQPKDLPPPVPQLPEHMTSS